MQLSLNLDYVSLGVQSFQVLWLYFGLNLTVQKTAMWPKNATHHQDKWIITFCYWKGLDMRFMPRSFRGKSWLYLGTCLHFHYGDMTCWAMTKAQLNPPKKTTSGLPSFGHKEGIPFDAILPMTFIPISNRIVLCLFPRGAANHPSCAIEWVKTNLFLK